MTRRLLLIITLSLLTSATLAGAADLSKSLRDAEGRKRAAENGARMIRTKAAVEAEQVKAQYADAATAHNAWLTAASDAVTQGSVSDLVNAAAAKAAATLVAWVAARNRALGEPVLAGAVATSVETLARQDLIDIATETTRKQRGADAKKAVDALHAQLRWKTWDEL